MSGRSSGSALAIIAGSVLLLAAGIFMRWRGAEEPVTRQRAVPPTASPSRQAEDTTIPYGPADDQAASAHLLREHPAEAARRARDEDRSVSQITHGCAV